MKKKLILLELNELNFDIAKSYISKYPGRFSGIEQLLQGKHIHTSSEECHEQLEPWIQWVSVHTGKSYAEHKIFRLGDIVGSKVPQFFEELEQYGISIGSISPMNAENRLKNPAYFIPDPWTQTLSDGSWWSSQLSSAISQGVNDNSQSKISMKSALYIFLGFIRFAKSKHYPKYLKLAMQSIGSSWRRALFLDLFLHDLHLSYFNDRQPNFSTLFLNSGAHIQHHFFYNSPIVFAEYGLRNPIWYISPKDDPFYEILDLYDCIVDEYLSSKAYELIVATGLSQIPYDHIKFYYRLKDHAAFLRKFNIKFLEIYPRMTRDFLITFDSNDAASIAQNLLSEIRILGKSAPLFSKIENRYNELFVTLTYPDEIYKDDVIICGSKSLKIFNEVAFVAVKNGMHQSKGFAFFTPGIAKLSPKNGAHVKSLYSTVLNYFNIKA